MKQIRHMQHAASKAFLALPLFILVIFTGCKKSDQQNISQPETLSSPSKAGGKTICVPFKASFKTVDEMTQAATDENPVQKDHVTGSGVGTVIGHALIDTYVEGDVTLPFPALITSTATFTAANGDKIYETSEGYLQEPSPEDVILHLTGKGRITGGTGRFANATGNLSFDVTQNMLDPNGTVTFTGNICF